MNNIREIQALNRRELENNVSPEASWHADYRDTAYVYIGGLPFELSEGDVIAIFSQFGEPVHLNLVRDKETGKSRGFAFLKYEDQRSTDLAVDNLGGATVMGRTLRVDHTRYKKKDDEVEGAADMDPAPNGKAQGDDREGSRTAKHQGDPRSESEEESGRPLTKEEMELMELIRDHDDDDPMKQYLIKEKREQVEMALATSKSKRRTSDKPERSSRRHRHRRDDEPRLDDDAERHRNRKREDRAYRSKRDDQAEIEDARRSTHRTSRRSIDRPSPEIGYRDRNREDRDFSETDSNKDTHPSRHTRDSRPHRSRRERAKYSSSEEEPRRPAVPENGYGDVRGGRR
ncbi:MAG: hypothetical protein M1825_001295 [Sarcosagium campestre]|nr:MAG: hypothetical protein M1825_001295 [Sarcosagium campestre]